MSYDYPLDLTGIAPTNLVQNEPQVITELNGRFSQIIIPDYAPFYLDNLKVVHISTDGTQTQLTLDTDYLVTYPYQDLARETGKMAFGAIVVVNTTAVNRFKITYQTIGDKWAANPNHVKQQLLEKAYNPRIAYWDQLTNVQDKFPPQDHNHELTESDKWPALLDAINRVTKAIVERDYNESSIYPTVVNYIDNLLPPLLTKAAVGLSEVENYPVATQEDIDNRENVPKYVLLPQVLQLVSGVIQGDIQANVQQLTSMISQVSDGLEQVQLLLSTNDNFYREELLRLEQNINDLIESDNLRYSGLDTRVTTLEQQVPSLLDRVQSLEDNPNTSIQANKPIPTAFSYFMSKA